MPYWTYYRRNNDNQKNLDDDQWITKNSDWEILSPQDMVKFVVFVKEKYKLDANDYKRVCKIDLLFYPGFSLYEGIPGDFYPIPQYYLINTDSSAHFQLDGKRTTLFEANKKCPLTFAPAHQQNVGRDILLKNYLYFFFAHQQDPKGRFMLCEDLKQIRWRFTLNDDESKYYENLLKPITLEPYEQSGHFEITLTAIQGDTLYELMLSLWPNGDVIVLNKKVIARYLPVIKDALGDFREDKPNGTTEPFNLEAGWKLLEEAEFSPLARLFKNIFPDIKSTGASYANRQLKRIWFKDNLGFFPTASLLRLDFDIIDEAEVSIEPLDTGFGIYILKGNKNRFYLLHGSGSPINEAIRQEEFEINDANILDFTRFYCCFIHSYGPFNILTQASDLNALNSPSSARNAEKAITEYLNYDELTLAEIENICQQPRPKVIREKAWQIDATVQCYVNLYNSIFTVDLNKITKQSSIVAMEKDQPIFTDIPIDNSRTIAPAFNFSIVKRIDNTKELIADFPYQGLFSDEKNGELLITKWESARLSKVSYANEFNKELRDFAGKTNQPPLAPRLVLPSAPRKSEPIDLHGLQFEDELVLKNFFFLSPLNLNDIEIKSFIDLSGSVFIDPHVYTNHEDIKPALTINDARIDGCCNLNDTLLMAELRLERCKIQGSFFAKNSFFFYGIEAPYVSIAGESQISDSKFFRNLNFQNSFIQGSLYLNKTFINWHLLIQSSDINSFNASDIEIKGDLMAWNAKIHSGCVLQSHSKTLSISGGINLILSKIGWLKFEAIEVIGNIDLSETEVFQNLSITSGRVLDDINSNTYRLQPTIASTINANGCRVQGNTSLRGTEIGFNKQNTKITEESGNLVFDHSSLDGHLFLGWDSIEKVRQFFEKDISGDGELKPIGKGVFCKINNSISLSGATVKGNVDLHGIQVGDNSTCKNDSNGLIDLTGAEIFGRTTCALFQIEAKPIIKAKCAQVKMRHLKAHNNIEFSGLEISGKKSLDAVSAKIQASFIFCDKSHFSPARNVKGKILFDGAEIDHLRISGNCLPDTGGCNMPLELQITSPAVRNNLAGWAFTFCFILAGIGVSSFGYNLLPMGYESFGLDPYDPSAFVLTALCFWLVIRLLRIYISLTVKTHGTFRNIHLIKFFTGLTAHECAFRDFMRIVSFNKLFLPETADKPPSSLSLANTSIGHLEIVNSIPALMDLMNLQVKRWSDDNAKRNHRFDFSQFLLRANAFNRSNYYSIEKYLRNNGYQETADQIRRSMHDTDRSLEKSGLYTLKNFLHAFIGYGTQVRQLIAMMVLWLVFSCVWFWQIFPKNFELNTNYSFHEATLKKDFMNVDLDNNQKEVLATALSKIDLNNVNKLETITGLVLRYHVPILNIDLIPYIEPKSEWLKGYTLLVTITHWIFWPVLLTSLIRSLLPNRE